MENFLRLTIDEYAIPAFCSSYKYMFGTLDDIKSFVDYLRGVQKATPLVEAFDKYLADNKKVKYNVAYNPMQMMHDCIVIEEREGSIKEFSYDFTNIWGFPYLFVADEFSFKRVMIQYRNQIVIAIKPSFKNLRIKSDIGLSDTYIKDCHWGFPGIYKYDEITDINETRLYLVERVYNKTNTEDVQFSRDFFNSDEFNLDTCFEEIVADG